MEGSNVLEYSEHKPKKYSSKADEARHLIREFIASHKEPVTFREINDYVLANTTLSNMTRSDVSTTLWNMRHNEINCIGKGKGLYVKVTSDIDINAVSDTVHALDKRYTSKTDEARHLIKEFIASHKEPVTIYAIRNYVLAHAAFKGITYGNVCSALWDMRLNKEIVRVGLGLYAKVTSDTEQASLDNTDTPLADGLPDLDNNDASLADIDSALDNNDALLDNSISDVNNTLPVADSEETVDVISDAPSEWLYKLCVNLNSKLDKDCSANMFEMIPEEREIYMTFLNGAFKFKSVLVDSMSALKSLDARRQKKADSLSDAPIKKQQLKALNDWAGIN